MTVSTTALATGLRQPGALNLGASAYTLSVALPDKAHATALIGGASNVADALLGRGARVYGIASLSTFGAGDYSSTFGSYPFASATFSFPYQGNLLLGLIDGFASVGPQIDVNGYAVSYSGDNSVIDLGSNLGPNIEVTVLDFDRGGGLDFEIAIGGTVPESSTWTMMLLGFGGLSFTSWRAHQKRGGPKSRPVAFP